MAFNEELADRIRVSLDGRAGVVERKMFGGVAFMIHGNMCCGVVNDDLMVRVGPDSLEASLALPHARPMDFTGRPMKGFVYVGPEGINDDGALSEWIARGESFARSLPEK